MKHHLAQVLLQRLGLESAMTGSRQQDPNPPRVEYADQLFEIDTGVWFSLCYDRMNQDDKKTDEDQERTFWKMLSA